VQPSWRIGNPYWTGASDRIAYRLRGRVTRLRAYFVWREDEQLLYPVSELAARYGASADEETSEPRRAYAPFERPRDERPSYWADLPWGS